MVGGIPAKAGDFPWFVICLICFLFQGYVKEYTYKQWPGQNVKLYHLFLAIQNYAKYKYGWKWSNHRDSSSSDMWYKYLMVCYYLQGNIPSLEVE